MKLTCVFIFFTCLNVSASVFSQQKVSLDVKRTKLSKVLKIIEEQSGYHFVYSSANVPVNKDYTLSVKDTPVADILSTIFYNTNLKYSISEGGLIVISRKKDVKISGTVKDNTGAPLPGASIRVKGSASGTSTDINGRFAISVPENAVLVISFAGFQSKEVNTENKTNIEVVLLEDTKLLSEVVVTALGIKKERRALGYSVSQIQGETLTQARENNVANSLVGKVAGLDVSATAGGVGAATSITIRGVSSLSQTNQPLYVINGMPMENKPVGLNNSNPNGNKGSQWDNAPDLGDAIGNLNPDDIESVSVLKGAAASALYGSRAKAGVILITTKSGKGTSIDFNSNYVVEQVMDRTNWQYVYGQGANGVKPTSASSASDVGGSSWGGKLDGSNVVQFDGVSRPYIAQKDNIKNFYRDGSTWSNTLALNKSFDGGSLRFSANDVNNNSIVPNSGLNRQSFNLVGTFEPIKRLTIDARANYILEQAKNRPMVSDGAGNANYNVIFLPTSVNVNDLKPWKDADGNEIVYNKGNVYATNPWFAANEFVNNTKRNRLISSFNAKYTFDNGFFMQGRAGMDSYTDGYKNVVPSGTAYYVAGKIAEQKTKFTDLNADILIGKSFKIQDDFTVTPNIGASYRNTKIDQTTNNGTDFAVFGVYNILNAANKSVGVIETESETQSTYGTLEIAYRDILYLTGSGRSDWFSTLATPGKDNKPYVFYPSVSGSFVFSELLQSRLLSFGKLRAGYAVVGQATDPYQTALTYAFRSETLNGKPLGIISNLDIPNSALKGSKASEFEIGTELRFFNDRLNLDLTWYKKHSKDEISVVTTSSTTGYNGAVLNSGEIENKGFEALISGVVIKNNNFSWTSSLNGSYNDNTVLKLAEGVSSQLIATSRTGNGFLHNIPGKSAGQVMAYDYKYDANGQVEKEANGAPKKGDLKAHGSAYNKWFAGWNNEFSYKGINLSFLIDGKWGGKLFSATDYYGYRFGLHQGTVADRESLGATAADYYLSFVDNVSTTFVQDASFIKFRQLTLGYNFPAKMFNNKIKSLNLSLVGRNLFILMKKTDNIDPESSYNATFPGLELGGVPPARTFGLNLSVKF
ncbi:SusC/RagA family TonB-linked outer membrane protein [Pedobacter africanus]|uniref:TonB-linked SusC/RagA family outer membrane protein n=1 Tax=Pedobacter africanus TaxID=151894 RepID=A0ACC6KSD3_9SPHI|nr:SusC/RagA family TonB-linked outer membrane protein [Pedobacter africanus]MDR6782121.1 TonB-linked SusC/RagA family outer membrane protein [Pedobacter africanus]